MAPKTERLYVNFLSSFMGVPIINVTVVHVASVLVSSVRRFPRRLNLFLDSVFLWVGYSDFGTTACCTILQRWRIATVATETVVLSMI